MVGFALSGAGTNFGLSDGLGTGRGDILQGGVYGATRFDNYYLAASLAASYYDVSTESDRVAARRHQPPHRELRRAAASAPASKAAADLSLRSWA